MSTLDIINLIESDKKERYIMPTHALKLEVINRAQSNSILFAKEVIEAELIELERTGKIRIGETLNDNYIKVL